MNEKIVKLERLIGYQFQDRNLIERALTHRSWAYENAACEDEATVREMQNESLEFVGDAVLGLSVVEQLFKKNPNASEGDLSLMKHRLVSRTVLAELAQELALGEFMRVGRGEEKTGGRRKEAILADAVEAIIGAILLDSGYVPARAFVLKIMGDRIQKATAVTSIDYKTLLQETLQADKRPAPIYNLVKAEGPDHEPTFYVEAVWDTGKAEAQGSSIKTAETRAANLALKELKKEIKVKKQSDRQREKKEREARRLENCDE